MRFVTQMMLFYVGASLVFPYSTSQRVGELPIRTNTIQGIVQEAQNIKDSDETRALKKVFLSNRSVTCNDGSQAGFYLRKSHVSKKWIIFLEGGWYCYDHHSCRNRWLRQRHYMTSSQWPETRDVGGILSPNEEENPFWWNANHVFVPYCTSDSWSGSKSSRNEMFSFMGSVVVQQVVKDLMPLGFENSTDLLLTGSSAGGTGVMLNLDPVEELIHETLNLPRVSVRGVTDSGWFLDRDPFAPTGKPAFDAIRKGMQHWQGKVPRRCRQMYMNEPWRCYFGYRLYPTLKSPLFVFQWLFDEAQMDVDNVGAPVTKQQWDYIHKMGDALRQSFENVTAVFAPSCISHSVLTKRDWQRVKIDDVSIAEALHCWEKKLLRRKLRKLKHMYGDQPSLMKKKADHAQSVGKATSKQVNSTTPLNGKRNRRRRRKNKRKGKNGHKGHNFKQRNRPNVASRPKTSLSSKTTERPRPQRSVLHTQAQKRAQPRLCVHRRLERCSWPQCNHSCPKLHNPFTGEEMDFIELLKSFGLDMESVARALGIDIQTLNSMDQVELLNLLTQQNN